MRIFYRIAHTSLSGEMDYPVELMLGKARFNRGAIGQVFAKSVGFDAASE